MKRQIKRREEDEIVMHTFDAKSSTSPFTCTKSNLRDRVLGEVEKDRVTGWGRTVAEKPRETRQPHWQRDCGPWHGQLGRFSRGGQPTALEAHKRFFWTMRLQITGTSKCASI